MEAAAHHDEPRPAMKITAVKAQARNAERVSVYVDGKYAFSLNHAQLLDQKLYSGLELTAARLAELKHISDFGKAYERALIFAMTRPHSTREMRDYFRRKKTAPEDAELILQKLTGKGYVNDAYFAKAWAESRALTRNISTRKLKLELKQKGITDDIIAQTLASSTHNESQALQDLIVKKRRQARYQDRQKLMQYLARQGFSFDDISQALDT